MDPDRAALAALADDVGWALIRYAGRLREPVGADSVGAEALPPPATTPPPAAASRASAATAVTSSVVETVPEAEVPEQFDVRLRRLGVSQKKALEVVRAAGEAGTTANQVAEATGLTSTNTPRMLKSLAERGLVASCGSNPIVWYARA